MHVCTFKYIHVPPVSSRARLPQVDDTGGSYSTYMCNIDINTAIQKDIARVAEKFNEARGGCFFSATHACLHLTQFRVQNSHESLTFGAASKWNSAKQILNLMCTKTCDSLKGSSTRRGGGKRPANEEIRFLTPSPTNFLFGKQLFVECGRLFSTHACGLDLLLGNNSFELLCVLSSNFPVCNFLLCLKQ